jgi:hypothetical protein
LVAHIDRGSRLRVFENRVLRRIFGPKQDEVAGKWRRLHNEKLYDLYSSPRERWTGHVARMGDRRGASGVWWGDLWAEGHLEDTSRLEDNIKIDLQKMEFGA